MTMPYSDAGSQSTTDGGQSTGQNPAWNELLNEIPQELHGKVTPHLQKWDQNFQNVQSSTAPYKEFIDQRVDPEYLKVAIGLANALEEQPELIYQALQEQFGGQSPPNGQNGQGQQNINGEGQGDAESEFDGLPPEIQQQLQMIPQLQQQVEMLSQVAAQNNQRELDAQEDAELDQLYQQMETESPMFKALNGEDRMAEPYINSLLMAGHDKQTALEIFSEFVDRVAQYHRRPQSPTLLGTSGFMPENTPKPRQLSESQTKDVIANYLRQAHNQ